MADKVATPMSLRFDGQVAIVTGSGRGIGRQYALALAARGAQVVVNDTGTSITGEGMDSGPAESVAREISDAGGRAVGNVDSVVDSQGARSIVDCALDTYGRLDIVVNNAGIITREPLEALSEELWDAMIAVHLRGTYQVTRAAWAHLRQSGAGRVVNTSSNLGFAGQENLSHYAAAKLGIVGFTRTVALEGAGHGIRANSIAPIAADTRMADKTRGNEPASGDGTNAGWIDQMVSGERIIGPADVVAPLVVWLSHRSCTASGELFSCSSGRVARVVMGVSEGYFNPRLTAEDIAAHADEIRRPGNLIEYSDSQAEVRDVRGLFTSDVVEADASQP